MKQKFSAAFTLAFLMALVLATGSCKKETAAETRYRLSSQYSVSGNIPYFTLYNYDEQVRIISTFGNQVNGFLSYGPNTVGYLEYQPDGSVNNSFTMQLDAAGRFTTKDGATFQYNSDGKLVRKSSGTLVVEYTWQDGNLVSFSTFISGVLSYTYTFTFYTDRPNHANWDYTNLGLDAFFGQDSKNLIKHSEILEHATGTTSSSVDWVYDFNDDGLPIKLTSNFLGSNVQTTQFFSYESY